MNHKSAVSFRINLPCHRDTHYLARVIIRLAMAISKSTHSLDTFLKGKSPHAVALFAHFVEQFRTIGEIDIIPAKTMIGIATKRKRVVYVTQLGKSFIHVVFPFEVAYPDHLCFQKIVQVPGQRQFNHHLRILEKGDVNKEVIAFMKLAWKLGRE